MMNADQAVPLRTLRGCMCELGSDEVLESIVRVSQEIDSGELSSVVRMCAQPRSGTSFFIFVVCVRRRRSRAVASRIPNNVMNYT
jgi:hypothetical protein